MKQPVNQLTVGTLSRCTGSVEVRPLGPADYDTDNGLRCAVVGSDEFITFDKSTQSVYVSNTPATLQDQHGPLTINGKAVRFSLWVDRVGPRGTWAVRYLNLQGEYTPAAYRKVRDGIALLVVHWCDASPSVLAQGTYVAACDRVARLDKDVDTLEAGLLEALANRREARDAVDEARKSVKL